MIKLKNVYYQDGDEEILKDISLEIEIGKKYLLLGPSGSGKTSLLKIMNNLYSPTSGIILLDGKKYEEYKAHDIRKKVGLIMQDPIMFGEYVYENFEFVKKATKREIEKDEIYRLLVDFGLKEDFYNKKNKELSGGEKYRISIIRTLLNKPSYILTDEPFAALDKTNMLKIFDYLNNWAQKNNTALVVISHTFENIIDKFDTIFFVKNGSLVFKGEPDEFMNNKNFIIKSFLAGENE